MDLQGLYGWGSGLWIPGSWCYCFGLGALSPIKLKYAGGHFQGFGCGVLGRRVQDDKHQLPGSQPCYEPFTDPLGSRVVRFSVSCFKVLNPKLNPKSLKPKS